MYTGEKKARMLKNCTNMNSKASTDGELSSSTPRKEITAAPSVAINNKICTVPAEGLKATIPNRRQQFSLHKGGRCQKRLQQMSSVTENNRIIPALNKVGNHPVAGNILLL